MNKKTLRNTVLIASPLLLLCGAKVRADRVASNFTRRVALRESRNFIYTDADGLKITALEREANDVAEVMGVSIWKFRLQAPKPGLRLRYALQLRQNGEVVESLGGGETGPLDETNMTPDIDYKNVEAMAGLYKDGDLWRCYNRCAGGASRGVIDELKGFNLQGVHLTPQLQKDNSFSLAEFGKGNNTPADGRLILSMTFGIVKDK